MVKLLARGSVSKMNALNCHKLLNEIRPLILQETCIALRPARPDRSAMNGINLILFLLHRLACFASSFGSLYFQSSFCDSFF